MQNKFGPIGLFDSGVGGTSIWKEIEQLMPSENTIYLADSRNAPYGEKSPEEIMRLSIKNTELLIEQGCKIVVVACNTATTNSIKHLRTKFDIPFIGIEPAIKTAALNSKSGAVGILATKGTLNSNLFHETAGQYGNKVKRVEIIGEGLVPLIEEGLVNGPQIDLLLAKYLKPMIKANVDHIVLGCSHYPYLIPAIKKHLPKSINIIDSGHAVARQTKAILKAKTLLNYSETAPPKLRKEFWTNDNPYALEKLLKTSSKAHLTQGMRPIILIKDF